MRVAHVAENVVCDVRNIMYCLVMKLLNKFVQFDYGMQGKNPIDSIWFHRKTSPNKAVKIDSSEVLRMLNKIRYSTLTDF